MVLPVKIADASFRIKKLNLHELSTSDQAPEDIAGASTTHFGYKTIDKADKVSMVAGVFHSVAKAV